MSMDRRAVVLALLAVVVVACAEETAIHDGRLTVTTWEVVAQPRDTAPQLRFVAIDSLWSAPGRPGAGGTRSSLAGPMTRADPEWESVRSLLLAMASRARITPEDSLVLAGEADEISRVWLLDIPVAAGSRIRGRYPVSYRRLESGPWAGEGSVRRDFRWIRRAGGGVPDTVSIRLDGVLSDTVGVLREARALEAEGTLSVASLGRVLDLTVRMRGVITRVPETEVSRRHEETVERLERALGGSER